MLGLPLSFGSKGDDVRELQELLIARGYPLPMYGVDGDFGSETENAVKQFQGDNGLPVNGIVDDKMWNLLLGESSGGFIPKIAGSKWKFVLIPVGLLVLIGLGISIFQRK